LGEIIYESSEAEVKLNFGGQMIMKENSRMTLAELKVMSFRNLRVSTKQGGTEI
jgi:hypothetical protein